MPGTSGLCGGLPGLLGRLSKNDRRAPNRKQQILSREPGGKQGRREQGRCHQQRSEVTDSWEYGSGWRAWGPDRAWLRGWREASARSGPSSQRHWGATESPRQRYLRAVRTPAPDLSPGLPRMPWSRNYRRRTGAHAPVARLRPHRTSHRPSVALACGCACVDRRA